MTELELMKRIKEMSQETIEFANHVEATEKLVTFLLEYVPEEKNDKMGNLLEKYSATAGFMAQRMIKLAEEIACEE